MRRDSKISKKWGMLGHSALGGLAAISGCIPLYGHAQTASAQTTDKANDDFGEIVVTAQKREEALRDVPLAVAAFTSENLANRGITTINDLGRQAPGLSLVERQNRTPNVVLRGVGSYGFVEGVGFYIDDVQNYTDKTMRLEDIERVEILKGPQGTLFGGSSLGGAVRYVSKRPKFETEANFRGELGSRSYQNAYFSANTPVSEQVAIRASGYYAHDDGSNKDSNLNTSTSELREYGLRGQLLFKPNDSFSALITARYRDFDGGYASYARQNGIDDFNTRTSLSFKPNYKTKTFGVVSELEYDFGGVSLISLSSFTRQKTRYIVDGDYTPAPFLVGEANGRPGKVYTQELRLTSESSETFDWILGAYAAQRNNVGNQVAPLKITIVPLGVVFDPRTDQTSKQNEYALFGNANYHFGNFTVTGGARLMRTIYKQNSIVAAGVPVTDANGARLKVADTVILPKGVLSYKTDGGTLLYASIAEGFEPGKVDASRSPVVPYRAETNWTYELGVKGDLGPDFYYELAAFYIKSNDRQAESLVTIDGVLGKRITNIGDASTIGVEAVGRWRPVAGLNLESSVAYLDAQWSGNAFFDGRSVKGRQIPNAPRWSANFAATYTVPVSNGLEVGLHADAGYKSSFPWQLTYNPISNRNPGFWVANARLSLGSETGNWSLAVRVENLFNEIYYTEFAPNGLADIGLVAPEGPDGTCGGCHLAATAPLRRAVVTLDVKF